MYVRVLQLNFTKFVCSVACHTQQWVVGVVPYCLNNNSAFGLLFEIVFWFQFAYCLKLSLYLHNVITVIARREYKAVEDVEADSKNITLGDDKQNSDGTRNC